MKPEDNDIEVADVQTCNKERKKTDILLLIIKKARKCLKKYKKNRKRQGKYILRSGMLKLYKLKKTAKVKKLKAWKYRKN